MLAEFRFLHIHFLYKFSNEDTKHLIHNLKEEGLAGIEVYHSSHHIGQITKLRQWQKEYDLSCNWRIRLPWNE